MEDTQNGEEHVLSLQHRREILRECEALVVYVSRHGNILKNNAELITAHKELSQLVVSCNGDAPSADDWKSLVVAYAKVTCVTYALRGVNGRSLLDTWGESDPIFGTNGLSQKRHLYGLSRKRYLYPLFVAIALFIIALILQMLAGWTGRIKDPGSLSWVSAFIYYFSGDLIPFLIPAAWGAIGSCIFLMKTTFRQALRACLRAVPITGSWHADFPGHHSRRRGRSNILSEL